MGIRLVGLMSITCRHLTLDVIHILSQALQSVRQRTYHELHCPQTLGVRGEGGSGGARWVDVL
jgi:hypothetical protein